MAHRRTGKVARLPKEARDLVNSLLQNGLPYGEIIIRLKGEGYACDLNEQNLVNWKEGGFKDWQLEQDRLADMAAKREFALEIVKQNEGSKIHEAGLQLAASQIYEVLTDFDPAQLKALLASAPENYAKLVNSIAKLSTGDIAYQKLQFDFTQYRDKVNEQKRYLENQLAKAREGGITPEAIDEMEKRLTLF